MITRRNLLIGLSALAGTTAVQASHSEEAFHANNNALDDWSKQARYPVTESNDPVVQQLLTSSRNQQPLAFYYFGGSSPRQLRLTTIESIFTTEDSPHRYITAYCHLRREHRTFRADRVSLA